MSVTRRDPGPITVWNRLLRGYGPFLVLVALALGMAVFVPSRVPEAVTAAPVTPGNPAAGPTSRHLAEVLDGAGVEGDVVGSSDGGTTAGPAGDSETAGGAAGAGGVQPCPDRDDQIPGDPYSPPCLTFSGDNGGATHRGVTDTEIHVTVRRTQDANLDEALASIVGAEIIDTPAEVERTLLVLADYINERFEMYGRRIVLTYYDGQGSVANELVGAGRDKAEVDATRVAEEIQPFADLSAITEPYADALTRRRVVSFGAPLLSREWLTERRPYAWSVLPDCSKLVESAMEFVIKRLSGPTADFAGGDLQGAPRRITALAPENSWYQECVRSAEEILRAAGMAFDAGPYTYRLDVPTMSNQAANLIPRMRRDGVTTILCGCDPILPVFLSGTANRQSYYPEFVSGYEQDFIGQLWDPEFQKQSFGISPLGPNQSQRVQETIGYAAFKAMSDDEPANAVDGLYYQLYMVAIGIQLAGPNLTPETFEQGMFSYPERLGPAGLWGFGPRDYTPMNDFKEFYWDPDAISTYNGKRGAWVDPNPGRRYRHGADELPHGPPEIPRR